MPGSAQPTVLSMTTVRHGACLSAVTGTTVVNGCVCGLKVSTVGGKFSIHR